MADKNNQVSKRTLYNLDTVSSNTVTPILSLGLAGISTTIGPSMQLVMSIRTTLEAHMQPIREMLEAAREYVQKIIRPMLEAVRVWPGPLSFLLTTRPVYYIPPRTVIHDQSLGRHLMVQNDDYGFFVIDGKQLSILHPASSRCGKLLAALLKHRSRVVDYKTLRQEIGAKDLDKTFKDLKYQLRRQGYSLDYTRPRSYGIALTGLKALQ